MAKTRSAKRQQITQLLLNEDYPALADLARYGVVTILLQMLFDPESLLHWRATEAIGYLAKTQPKRIKEIIPRLLWSLNEDSASFGWGAAAVLGEIGKNNYKIVEDITLMLFQFPGGGFYPGGYALGISSPGTNPSPGSAAGCPAHSSLPC